MCVMCDKGRPAKRTVRLWDEAEQWLRKRASCSLKAVAVTSMGVWGECCSKLDCSAFALQDAINDWETSLWAVQEDREDGVGFNAQLKQGPAVQQAVGVVQATLVLQGDATDCSQLLAHLGDGVNLTNMQGNERKGVVDVHI